MMKRVYWFCLAMALVGLVLFHQGLLNALASCALHLYSVAKWGVALDYEALHCTGNRLIVDRPRFKGDSSFSARRVEAALALGGDNAFFHMDLQIHQPCWKLSSAIEIQGDKWKKLLKKGGKGIRAHYNLQIREGSLFYVGMDDSTQQLHFDLDADSHEGCSLHLRFDPDRSPTRSLLLQAVKTPHGMKLICRCQEASGVALSALAHYLRAQELPFILASGSLQGEVQALFPPSGRPQIDGELWLEKASVRLSNIPLTGYFEQARLRLHSTHAAKDTPLPFSGELDLFKPVSLNYTSSGEEWSIGHIEGHMELQEGTHALVDLHLKKITPHPALSWNLRGAFPLQSSPLLRGELNFFCSTMEDAAKGSLHLSYCPLRDDSQLATLQLKQLSHEGCASLQTLLSLYWPALRQIAWTGGTFDALIAAEITRKGIGALQVKQFEAIDSSAYLKRWNTTCHVERISGSGQVDLGREKIGSSLLTSWRLESGSLRCEGIRPSLDLSNIQAQLSVSQGTIEHSLVTFQWAGLKGKMDMEWGGQKQLLMCQLEGTGNDLATLVPSRLERGMRLGFDQNRISIIANIERKARRLRAEGTLHVSQADRECVDLIHFGCELKKIGASPRVQWVPCGWFYGRHLPLENFLSPFIFKNGAVTLRGEAEVKGSFDDEHVILKYDADHLRLENEALLIDIPSLHAPTPGELVGSHQIDLNNGSHYGSLPIREASYLDKESGLRFQDIEGLVLFDPNSVILSQMEGYCEEVYMAGECVFDHGDPAPGVFDVTLRCPILSGTAAQVQRLLSHLPECTMAKHIPLEGTVSGKEQGLELAFHFFPEDYTLQARMRGTVTDGYLSLKGADMALKGIFMDVDYRHEARCLEFSDIQGSLLVGKPHCVHEYPFLCRYIRLHHAEAPDFSWDIAIHDQDEELARLVGHTRPCGTGLKEVVFDSTLSHISSLYPETWCCRIHNDAKIDKLEYRSEFDLGVLLRDLQRFRDTGLLGLSDRLLTAASPYLSLKGRAFLRVAYQPDEGWHYTIEGDPMREGEALPHHGLLQGNGRDGKWTLDPLRWDGWQAYVELQHTEEKWKIPFLGLKMDEALLLGLHGEFIPSEDKWRATLDMCEIHLGSLAKSGYLSFFTSSTEPKGLVKLSGQLEGTSPSSSSGGGLHASLLAETRDVALGGYPLEILDPFRIVYQPDGSFLVERLTLTFPMTRDAALVPTLYTLDQLECHKEQDSLGFSFFSHYERSPFRMRGRVAWPSCQEGECMFFDLEETKKPLQPLVIKWENVPEEGRLIRSLQGEFSGSIFSLEANREQEPKSEWSALKGQVILDIPRLSRLLSPDAAKAIEQANLAACPRLNGDYWLRAQLDRSLSDSVAFKGSLDCHEFMVHGYRLQQLQGELQYVPGRLDVQRLAVEDAAGNLFCDHLVTRVDPSNEKWLFFIPRLIVKNFRIGLLRNPYFTPAHPNSKLRSLLIKRIDLQNFSGEWADRYTWHAAGSLHFLNRSRKPFSHPLLAIPAEIILRLGLDPQVLNPVTGTVYFDIQNGRFDLTRFKDVYSEGRGSKFYLAKGEPSSWMDFNGNLSVQVRMKQYNLFFKIAELFTVSIAGNLTKPQYTLQRHARLPHKE